MKMQNKSNMLYLINSKNKIYPEPKNESYIVLQDKGKVSLSTYKPVASSIFTNCKSSNSSATLVALKWS